MLCTPGLPESGDTQVTRSNIISGCYPWFLFIAALHQGLGILRREAVSCEEQANRMVFGFLKLLIVILKHLTM